VHLCGRRGWRSCAATPNTYTSNARAHARRQKLAHARAVARTESHLRFQRGCSVCERAWTILHRPTDRWRSPLRDKEKGPGAGPGPLMSEVGVAAATGSSLLSSAEPGRTYAGSPGRAHARPRNSSAYLSGSLRQVVLRASRWSGTSWTEI